EVMGIDRDFGSAFAKSQTAAYGSLPAQGTIFVSVANRDKRSLVFPVKRLADLGFRVLATEGTAELLRRNGIPCDEVRKHFEDPQPGRDRKSVVKGKRVDLGVTGVQTCALPILVYRVLATEGTAEMLRRNGIPCDEVRKHFEDPQPGRPETSAVDAIRAGDVD